MRLLIIGAGALGGYYGGRLLAAKRDVTFLLRHRRVAELEKTGLLVKSQFGDLNLPSPPHVLAEEITAPFDAVIVACKAYDLAATMESFAPAVGPETAILPLLNGIRHLDQLAARFGEQHVLGGQCLISAALDPNGAVLHLNDTHTLAFGERDGSKSSRVDALSTTLSGANFDARASSEILQEMWEKWVFIATGAAITCLMRASVSDIVAAGAADLTSALFEECAAISTREGFPPRAASNQRSLAILTKPESGIMASMLRDVERGAPTEADHILGDLLQRGGGEMAAQSLLRIAYAHLKACESRRKREAAAPGKSA
jgi:2-dehydropantoate 2-reductase